MLYSKRTPMAAKFQIRKFVQHCGKPKIEWEIEQIKKDELLLFFSIYFPFFSKLII